MPLRLKDLAQHPRAPVRYEGNTGHDRIFGPPWIVVAKHHGTELHDYKEHASHLLDKSRLSVQRVLSHEAFYEFKGGDVLGYITKKVGEPWKLSITLSKSGQFPLDKPDDFPTWQAAWAYVAERL